MNHGQAMVQLHVIQQQTVPQRTGALTLDEGK